MFFSFFEHDTDEEDPKQEMFSAEDVDRFVQLLKQNESFNKYLFSFFQQNNEVPHPVQNNQNNPAPPKQQNKTKKKRSKSFNPVLIGITSSASKDTLEEDLYSIMMMTEALSLEWFLGFLSFFIQVTLASIIIFEQTQTEFFGTDMSIPIRVPPLTRVTQVLSVILALMTQNEFLSGLRTIFMFPFENKLKWGKICDIESSDCTRRMWLQRILLPNAMKAIQGIMVLVASFVVIVQLTSTVDVLKDYSALFVVSSVDNFFFDFAEKGYFGEKVRANAEKVKDTEFEEIGLNHWLRALFFILIGIFVSAWVSIFAQQVQGVYVKQAYPLCDHDAKFNNTEKTFLNIIGDTRCQFPQGEGTNIVECGWDGGDCEIINDRYPECDVDDFSLLGDGNCDHGVYNSKDCGFDNGDCVDFNEEQKNQYNKCMMVVENIGWIGDGICNGGTYASDECGNDGGDCLNCVVDDINLVGDGTCDGSEYNNKACSFDGGDCIKFNQQQQERYPGCNVENKGWISDTICNGGEYTSEECGNDGGDCKNCFSENIAWMLFGDGFCDEENNVDGCSFDGNDCVPSMKQIGDKYDGMWKWVGGVVGHDGNIYGIPYYANKILKIDPSANATNPTALVGEDLGPGGWQFYAGVGNGGGKWRGGVVGNDGIIYGVPYDAKSILSFNTTSEKTQLIAEGHPLLESSIKFIGGVLAKNRRIYFIPYQYNKVIKFDPSNLENPLTEIGGNLRSGGRKMWGGALGSDGNIYGIPYYGNRVLKINVADDTTSFIGDDHPGRGKWWDGILAKDGNIYACPSNAIQILQIHVENQTTNLVGPNLGYTEDRFKWSGFVEGKDGFLYGIPYGFNEILRFDPINHTATLIPLPEEMHGDGRFEGEGDLKWYGGARAENGFIYAIPRSADQVLSISPLKFRP